MQDRALLWVETSAGGGHLQVASQLSRELQGLDVAVDLCTSSMDLGEQYDFGDANLLALEQIKGDDGGQLFYTHNGTFPIPGIERFRAYLYELEQASLPQVHTLEPNLDRVRKPWDDIIEPSPFGAWQREIRRYITNRQETLRRIFNDTKPNAVITEFWPLGRTNSDVELSPFMSFIDSGPHRPIIFSLERDVLLTQKTREQVAGEDFRTDRRIVNTNRFIDEVIVRGDESVFQLQDTLPEAIGIERPIFYAGYFASPLPERTNMSEEKREVVVSAGGGYRPQDKQLYLAAIAARTHTSLDERTWRLLITPNCPENVFKEITAVANETSSKIIVERNKSSSEFKQLLSDCALSISQGGYNTTIEVATGDAPAVIVPAMDHSGREKNEQSFRAKRFEEMNLLSVVEQDQANAPYAFAQTIELAMLQQRKKQDVQVAHFRLEGAKRAAGKIVERLKEKRANV